MKCLASSLLLTALCLAAFPVHAETTPMYPSTVVTSSNQVLSAVSSLGAPDGVYTTFQAKDATETLDFGTDVTGDLSVTYQLLLFGAKFSVDFLDAQQNVLAMGGGTFNIGTSVVVPYGETVPYRYVRITDTDGQTWKLDAVAAAQPAAAPLPIPSNPVTTPTTTAVPSLQGTLVKLADDRNPKTTVDSAVYEIGADGKRHAFPSEQVFFSWFKDFSGVKVIAPDVMASYPLGPNVTMRSGTRLIKITTDPKVYAVEPGAVLRGISNEATAIQLYGSDWKTRVTDVADVFFGNYKTGPALDVVQYPEGTLLRTSGDTYYLVKGGKLHLVSPPDLNGLDRFQSITIDAQTLSHYFFGDPLVSDPSIQFPY